MRASPNYKSSKNGCANFVFLAVTVVISKTEQ